MRAALKHAVRIHLVEHNVALDATAPRPTARAKQGPDAWTIEQLRHFLTTTQHLRLHPALHLAATTGMRRGELAGQRWGDWNRTAHSISVARARQSVGGHSVEVPCKTKNSRRCIDLDPHTETVLAHWKRRQHRDGHRVDLDDAIFTNTKGQPVHPESISQLFTRQLARINLPTIRFHDLRHTHATLLAGSSTPIKVVSERLGHAHPGFTMATYQHVMPGMGAAAAHDFGLMLSTQREARKGYRRHTVRPATGRRLPAQIRRAPAHRIATPTAGR
jgi:integrase